MSNWYLKAPKIGIYKIQSLCHPERYYIGSAVNIIRRWKEHRKVMKGNRHDNPKLQNHINKYGIDDLLFTVLEECIKEKLIEREQHYIDTLNPWFNINKTANSRLGMKLSDETKFKISKAHIGKHLSEETKLLLSQKGQGRKFTDEHRNKISLALQGKCHPWSKNQPAWNKGSKLTQEAKNRISCANKGKKYPPRSDAHRKALSEANKGKVYSTEFKLRLSNIHKERWNKRKNIFGT